MVKEPFWQKNCFCQQIVLFCQCLHCWRKHGFLPIISTCFKNTFAMAHCQSC